MTTTQLHADTRWLSDHPTVTHNLYKDIHKAIRVELFTLTATAGRTDPTDRTARQALADTLRDAFVLLDDHAHHEDDVIGPVLADHLPHLAEQAEADHRVFDGRAAYLQGLADAIVTADADQRRTLLHHLHLDLAGFTSAYLAHQDLEERTIMPGLEAAVGVDEVRAIEGRILASIEPPAMAHSLALMLPAINIDDRTEMLAGMRANAPAEVFEGVWGLAGTVLTPEDHAALGVRLGLA